MYKTSRPLSFGFRTLMAAAVIFGLAGVPPAQAQCVPNLGVFFIDLRLPFDIDTSGAVSVESLAPNMDCADGSFMARLRIDIPEACERANVMVEYEGTPTDWTLNLGDSPTNNGFGGDFGATAHNAELQILDQTLSVYNAADNPGDIEHLANQHLALTDGVVKISVADQTVGWGQPRARLETPDLQRLFAIPDPTFDGRTVYLGVNRVVNDTSRRGCGARRVLISFQ